MKKEKTVWAVWPNGIVSEVSESAGAIHAGRGQCKIELDHGKALASGAQIKDGKLRQEVKQATNERAIPGTENK